VKRARLAPYGLSDGWLMLSPVDISSCVVDNWSSTLLMFDRTCAVVISGVMRPIMAKAPPRPW